MLFRFAIVVTVLEFALTALASVLVTYTEPPPGFVTERELRDLGFQVETHENQRWTSANAPCYDTRATFGSPTAKFFASLRTDGNATDFRFRRSREEALREKPGKGDVVLIDEPIPGEEGYAVRHRSEGGVRFELVRLRRSEMLIVKVVRTGPFDTLPAAELTKCERRARIVQEHLMSKLRWRD